MTPRTLLRHMPIELATQTTRFKYLQGWADAKQIRKSGFYVIVMVETPALFYLLQRIGFAVQREDFPRSFVSRPLPNQPLPRREHLVSYTLQSLSRSQHHIPDSLETRNAALQGQLKLTRKLNLRAAGEIDPASAPNLDSMAASQAAQLSLARTARRLDTAMRLPKIAAERDRLGRRNPAVAASMSLQSLLILSAQSVQDNASRIAHFLRTPIANTIRYRVELRVEEIIGLCTKPIDTSSVQLQIKNAMREARIAPYHFAYNYVSWRAKQASVDELAAIIRQAYIAEQVFAEISDVLAMLRRNQQLLTLDLLDELTSELASKANGFDDPQQTIASRVHEALMGVRCAIDGKTSNSGVRNVPRLVARNLMCAEEAILERIVTTGKKPSLLPQAEIWLHPSAHHLMAGLPMSLWIP